MPYYFTPTGFRKLLSVIEMREGRLRDVQSQTAEIAELGGNAWHDNAGYDDTVIQLRGADRLLADLHKIKNESQIVDILEKPTKASFLSKLWNKYYVWFLKDLGETFLNQNSFQSLVEKAVKGKEVTFGEINTIKGPYMYASIISTDKQAAKAVNIPEAVSQASQNHLDIR